MEEEKVEAVRFYENEDDKPHGIYFMGEGYKKELEITSDNREYVRGDKLCVTFNGIEIYADLDQAIYINTETKVVFIKKRKKLSPPEKREYLVLLVMDDESTTFQGIVGRQETFDYIKSIVDSIDIQQSLVLAETVALKDSITIYEFMHNCIINNMVNNEDGFDIEEYYFQEEE